MAGLTKRMHENGIFPALVHLRFRLMVLLLLLNRFYTLIKKVTREYKILVCDCQKEAYLDYFTEMTSISDLLFLFQIK